MKTEINFSKDAQLSSIVVSPDVPSASSEDQEKTDPYGGDFASNANAAAQPPIEKDPRYKIQFIEPKSELTAWTIGIVAAAALFLSVQRYHISHTDKVVSSNVPAATQDSARSSSKEPCKFEGTRSFIAPKDMDILVIARRIVGIRNRPECEDQALGKIVHMNSNHPYATTTLEKGRHAKMPIRIVN